VRLLQATIDLDLAETTPAQRLFAWLVIGATIITTLYLLYRTHYAGLPERLKRAKADFRGARADTTLQSVYVPRDVARDEGRVREIVHSVLDEDPPDQPTLRTAAGSVQRQLAETWMPVLARLPPAARRVLGLAVVVVVFGLVAVSTDVLTGALQTSSPNTQPAKWPALAVSETMAVVGELGGTVGGLPGAGIVWALVVLVGVTAGSWLYTHWYVVAGGLLAGGVALYHLDQQLEPGAETRWIRSLPQPGEVARAIIFGIGTLWLITIGSVGIGRVSGPNDAAVTYGAAALAAAGTMYLLAGGVAVYLNRDRIAALPERWESATPLQQRYLAARGVTLAFATLVAPLVPVWVGVALTKTPTLLGAYFGADIGVQLLGAVAVAGVASVLAWQAQAAWGDVRSAVRITAAHSSTRSVALARGVPYIAVAVTYALVAGVLNNIIVGLVAAIAVGLLAREAVALLTRARYRVSVRDTSPTAAQRVVIEGAPLETRDGDVQWYIRINGGTELLHPDREHVADDAVTVATQLVDDGTSPVTLSECHAEHAFEHGTGDPEETVAKLDQDVRQTVFHALREHGDQVPNEHIDDRVDDVPEPIVDARLRREEYRLGNIARDDQYTTLRNDPYRS
jgi:hypothetical protein